MSVTQMFSRLAPSETSRLRQASAAAPAPEATIFTLPIFLPARCSAFCTAAATMMAVPCWSSWKTGIFMRSFSWASTSKHSGALMSSRLMPPKVGSSADTTDDHALDLVRVDLDVEHVDAGEFLEQHRLAFHHRLGGERADIAEAEHRGAVGDDGDEVCPRGELGGLRRIGGDRLAGGGDARRIGERQVVLVAERLGRLDFELSGPRQAVIDERAGAQVVGYRGGHCHTPVQTGPTIWHLRRRTIGERSRAIMGKILIGLLAAAVIAVGGYFGFEAYVQRQIAGEVEAAFAGIRASGAKATYGKVHFDLWSRTITVADISGKSAAQPPVSMKIGRFVATGVKPAGRRALHGRPDRRRRRAGRRHDGRAGPARVLSGAAN